MKIHHLILIIVLVFFVFKNTNRVEGNTNSFDTLIEGSSLLRPGLNAPTERLRIREELDGLKRRIQDTLEIDIDEIEDEIKKEILFSEFIANMENENNNDITNCISDNCNYKKEIQDMYLDFAERYDKIRIEKNPELKDIIENKISEDSEYYKMLGNPEDEGGLRYEQVSKRYLDIMYKKCRGDYKELQTSQNCDDEIKKARIQEEKKCDESSKNINNSMNKLQKKLRNYISLQKQIKRQTKELFNLKKRGLKNKKYCQGRRQGRHPRHCGGRTIKNKNECEKTYKIFRGRIGKNKNHKCQWVHSSRSCDFYQPGRPNTKKLC
jgi:hypothetical protein